jgi:isoleucyl-tRNA synthetase
MTNIKENEEEIINFWKNDKTFEKSLKQTEKSKPYIFYDGPPFATGLPHYGHLLGSIVKDVYGRFWTMNDRFVRRIWGWDCHGLPIENIAEKDLGINSKDEIEKIGVSKFNHHCRSKVLSYADDWEKVINRIGRWVDMKNCYRTMDNEYIESVWWAFKELWKKGYIYEGEKILMYCPRCSTPLSKSEIAMDNSYKNVKDETVVIKFKLKDEDAYALAWTTTPWTLPSNLALAVNPNLDYCYVQDKTDGTIYLLGKELVSKFFKNPNDYEIIKEMKGSELEGKEYEPLFDYFKDTQNSFKFILGDFVTSDDGTGIVHTAPAFGEDDYLICRKYNIPAIQPVDEKGLFKKEVRDFEGKFIHDTNSEIIAFLKKQGKIVLVKKMEHEYPFCYRCDTKLMYRAIPAWFVDIQKIKPRLIELNKKLNWYPEFLKEGRVKYTIETAPDWNVSRNRYWATAMPIWVSNDGEKLVIGSIDELKKYAKNLPKKEIDLHKDFLDKIILEKDGKEFKRIPEVLDCWFESGSMTFAQFHYPFENKEFFEENFPAQFVAEYIGQVRAWFYYMLVLSTILFEDIPFENVVTTGTILAEDGEKMSKSKNNFIDPMILVNKYGADTLRFYLMSCPVMNADNLNFSDKYVEDIYKKMTMLLHNVINFYNLYSEIPDSKTGTENIMDKWIISRINELNMNTKKSLEEYNTIKASKEIMNFIEDLSTWYIRRSKERFNVKDKEAKATLKYVLELLSKIIAPITPFVAETLFKTVGKKSSVHLEKWPNYDDKIINNEINKNMVSVREIVSLALKERDKAKISLKQPLAMLKVGGYDLNKEYLELIKDEVNVKEVSLVKSEDKSVELNTKLTPELEAEGMSRIISRKIQSMRKEIGLVQSNKIETIIICSKDLTTRIEKWGNVIAERTGSKKIEFKKTMKNEKDYFKKNLNLNEEELDIYIKSGKKFK